MKLRKNVLFVMFALCGLLLSSCSDTPGSSSNYGPKLPSGNTTLNKVVTPTVEKTSEKICKDMSKTTYDSYMAFANKFVSFMMKVNNSSNEQSMGVSIPDAYICLAIVGAISDDAARSDILNYLELANMDELRTAVKEVVNTLATLTPTYDGKYDGGYNLNSIWLNPKKVQLLKQKDEELYKDLAEIFDAYIFNEPLITIKANQYLKDFGLKNLPTPKISLNDNDPAALSVMSVYYCLANFGEHASDYFKEQYRSGTHKIDYEFNGKKSKVDYILDSGLNTVYKGKDFYGSTFSIYPLNIGFFLPVDKTAKPSTILSDVLKENYELKMGKLKTYYLEEDEEGNMVETDVEYTDTTTHDVKIYAPYFSLDNELKLGRNQLETVLPVVTKDGAGRRLVEPSEEYKQNGSLYGKNELVNEEVYIFLDEILQFSTMKFNYDGFYSCSVTIAQMQGEAGAAGGGRERVKHYEYEKFELKLNHPYVFAVRKSIRVDESVTTNVPIVVGEIIDPAYKD